MIYFVIGTKAQLIKMAPVMVACRSRNIPYRYISTGQHRETMDDILNNFGLPSADITLYKGEDITSVPKMFLWSILILAKVLWSKKDIFSSGGGIILVHGDTFSTLLGALIGRVAGIKVGHVESGLRSFRFFHPFPEELIRLAVFRLADVFFCPGAWAAKNVEKYSGEVINTHGNTLADSLLHFLANQNSKNIISEDDYAVVTLHRYENVFSRSALVRTIECVEMVAETQKCLFILHKPTHQKLVRFGLYDRLKDNPNIKFYPRFDYFSFMHVLNGARFVVSDGGSNQEECFYLGKPILLLREATERQEGIGENCVVSAYNSDIVKGFRDSYAQYSRSPSLGDGSPSAVIAEYCRDHSGA